MIPSKASGQFVRWLCNQGRQSNPPMTVHRGRALGLQLSRYLSSVYHVGCDRPFQVHMKSCTARNILPSSVSIYNTVPMRCYYSTQSRLKEKSDAETTDTRYGEEEAESRTTAATKVDPDKKSGDSFVKPVDSSETPQSLEDPETLNNLTVFQRFKLAYKQYGKVLIGVHVATSVVWYSSFVYAASCGVDVIPLLEWMGASETVIRPFKASGLGNLAVGYLLYKLATPARYTVTLAGTQMTVQQLRKRGYMEPLQEKDRIGNLMRESSDRLKDKSEEIKDIMKDKSEEMKDKMKDKSEEMKDKMKDRYKEGSEALKDKREQMKDKSEMVKEKMIDRYEEWRDKAEEMKDKAEEIKETAEEMKDSAKKSDSKDT